MTAKKHSGTVLKEWRRIQVLELSSKGHNQSEIAKILQVDSSVICRDVAHIREQAKENIRKYVDEKLPEEYEKCLVGIGAILKEAWNTVNNPEDKKDKLHALSLVKDCYSMKLELITNATIIEDALKFVQLKKENLSNNENNINTNQNAVF